MPVQSYRDLVAWQKAIELVAQCYTVSRKFPASERFGLTAQLQRAAVSIAANIAEGYGRRTRGEYLQFLGNARASLREVETLLIIANRIGILPHATHVAVMQAADEVGKVLHGLIRSLSQQ